jgi:glycosyltransferase involved in cell wall biosynthesis
MGVLFSQLSHWPLDKTFGAVDIFHATNHLLAHFGRTKTVFTLHDLIFLQFPEYHLPYNRWYLTFAMPRFLAAADVIVTPSECSRQDAIKFYGIPESKIKVIYEAAAPSLKPAADPAVLDRVREKYHLPEKFMLHVGTIEPRKNLDRLLEAAQRLRAGGEDVQLVIVGGKGWLYQSFFQRLETLALEDAVHLPGYVPDADLPAVYSGARLVTVPSLYEGFGLPVLEAMARGAPVVCSNTSSLPEVGGDAAGYFDPTDVAAMAETIQTAWRDETLRERMRQDGLTRAAQFSWARAADETLAVYDRVFRSISP